MKVVLSVDPIKFPLTGIGRYTCELAHGLQQGQILNFELFRLDWHRVFLGTVGRHKLSGFALPLANELPGFIGRGDEAPYETDGRLSLQENDGIIKALSEST